MPMRWDERARTTLLLKLIEQNPTILSKVNADTIASSWPGPDKPTGRAIIEQIKTIRKQVATGNATAPATPRRGGLASHTSSPPRTPKTPARSITTCNNTSSSSTKRSNKTTHHNSNDASSKKRKLTKSSDDSESEAPELTSSADETEDDEPLPLSTVITKRTLPARSKSRTKSYVAATDSVSEDDYAKDPYSDDDAEFSLDAQVKGGAKRGGTGKFSAREKQGKRENVLHESTDEDGGLRDERGEKDSDEESQTTAGKSHQTFVSALEDDF